MTRLEELVKEIEEHLSWGEAIGEFGREQLEEKAIAALPELKALVCKHYKRRFAAAKAAMTGILSGGTVFSRESSLFGSETLAEMAYKCADAMLARERKLNETVKEICPECDGTGYHSVLKEKGSEEAERIARRKDEYLRSWEEEEE